MQHLTLSGLCFLLVAAWAVPGFCGDFDGSKSLFCVADRGIEYHPIGDPQHFDPESVGLPQKFIVDFKNGKIEPTPDSLVRRTTRIGQLRHIEQKLILQGADEGVEGIQDGIGWTMAISKETGKFAISASGTAVGYIVLGECKCRR